MSDIFISHDTRDSQQSSQLEKILKDRGRSVSEGRDITGGTPWRNELLVLLKSARCVVVLWSNNSAASTHVREEAEVARTRGTLLSVKIEAMELLPYGFNEYQFVDLSDWKGEPHAANLQNLLAAIEKKLAAPAAPAAANRAPWGRRALVFLALAALVVVIGGVLVALMRRRGVADFKAAGDAWTRRRDGVVSLERYDRVDNVLVGSDLRRQATCEAAQVAYYLATEDTSERLRDCEDRARRGGDQNALSRALILHGHLVRSKDGLQAAKFYKDAELDLPRERMIDFFIEIAGGDLEAGQYLAAEQALSRIEKDLCPSPTPCALGAENALHYLGTLKLLLGDTHAAEELLLKARALYSGRPDQAARKLGELNVGLSLAGLGAKRANDEELTEKLEGTCRAASHLDPMVQGNCHLVLADILRSWGRYSDARFEIGQALAAYKKSSNQLNEGDAYWSLGEIDRILGRSVHAAANYERAETAYQGHFPEAQGRLLRSRADIALAEGHFDKARVQYETALERFRKEDRDTNRIPSTLFGEVERGLGDVAYRKDDFEGAVSRYDQALEIAVREENRFGRIEVLRRLVDVERTRKKLSVAEDHLKDAWALAKWPPINRQLSADLTLAEGDLERDKRSPSREVVGLYERALGDYQFVSNLRGQVSTLWRLVAVRPLLKKYVRELQRACKLLKDNSPELFLASECHVSESGSRI